MRHAPICVVISFVAAGLAAGCPKDEAPPPPPPEEPVAPAEVVHGAPDPALTRPDAAPARPEPTTPEEIDQARKTAMIEGKDKDVIKYCEMQKVDPKKTDPQVLLGCALASCRIGEIDKAKTWAANLPKALKDQAIKICAANNVKL